MYADGPYESARTTSPPTSVPVDRLESTRPPPGTASSPPNVPRISTWSVGRSARVGAPPLDSSSPRTSSDPSGDDAVPGTKCVTIGGSPADRTATIRPESSASSTSPGRSLCTYARLELGSTIRVASTRASSGTSIRTPPRTMAVGTSLPSCAFAASAGEHSLVTSTFPPPHATLANDSAAVRMIVALRPTRGL